MDHRLLARVQLFCICTSLCLTGFGASAASGQALGYTVKYPADFECFDYTDPRARIGGSLRVAGIGSYDSFNPFLLKGTSAAYINILVFETLMLQSLDEPFSAYSLLALDMRPAADGLSVEFDLDPRARFNDDTPVTAHDVVYSFQTLVSLEAHPRFRIYFQDVADAIALDDDTVRFNFHRKNSELALVLATGMPIFSPRWSGDQPFAKNSLIPPVSSGPYRIEEHKLGSFIRYQRREDYWGWQKPTRRHTYSFAHIHVEYYFDLSIALEAFKSGRIDAWLEYNSKQWARAYVGPEFDNGRLIRKDIRHHANAGIQGFIFNLRKPKFQDLRVRQAITDAFDFYWANRSLFFEQYTRNHSYFSNSELAARGLPSTAESALLEPWRDQLPATVFEAPRVLQDYRDPPSVRAALIDARRRLIDAGWIVVDGRLVNERGEVFTIEFLLAQVGFERILMPFAHNLKKLGIELKMRRVDRALYIRRQQQFDYDMIVGGYSASESPGNELYDRFGGVNVDTPGSLNYSGIANPAIDGLIDHIVYSENRQELIDASRALDRVLWSQYLLVPNWYTDSNRLAWNSRLAMPETLPLYYSPLQWVMQTWWWRDE